MGGDTVPNPTQRLSGHVAMVAPDIAVEMNTRPASADEW
jgi:hypothetical protein